jgi:uncharacterized protein (DUF1800 family)
MGLLTGCGGGKSTTSTPNDQRQAVVTFPASDAEARRFLTQATFGPTDTTTGELVQLGYEPWLQQQLQMPQAETHLAYYDRRKQALLDSGVTHTSYNEFSSSFWHHALYAPDQLRQRVAFALSEIFVVSAADSCGADHSRGLASYYDVLAHHAFGSYRALLGKVSSHPVMGCYLSSLRNQKEDASTGRVPDENYAREVMQLFSIGLYELNTDGSPRTDAQGQPIETYRASDVAGLAKVFTGFSFNCPDGLSDNCFRWGANHSNPTYDVWTTDMVGYAKYHSNTGPKQFLGLTLPARDTANPQADLDAALDHLASHANVGPFLGRQLIQRLVTSNPSSDYVARVSTAFELSGRNLGAMVKAILTDPEARLYHEANTSLSFGKVREPILRFTALLRAAGTASDSGQYLIDSTDAVTQVGQSPLRAPSVFNYFRPGYVPPRTQPDAQQLVAPEMQIVNESTLAGYVNHMRDTIGGGFGRWQVNAQGQNRQDVRLSYTLDNTHPWLSLARQSDASALISLVNTQLMYGTMPASLAADIKATVEALPLSSPPTDNQVLNRLKAALLLTVVSPEFLVQK